MKIVAGIVVLLAVAAAGCGGSGGGSGGGSTSPSAPTATVSPAPTGRERYVTIAFWNNSTCSGEPAATHRFPVHYGGTRHAIADESTGDVRRGLTTQSK